jgi:hypothetical protein
MDAHTSRITMLLKVTITLEGPAGELAARLRAVAAALEDPDIDNNVIEVPAPLAAPAVAQDAPEPTPEPEQAPPRNGQQTPAQKAALAAYRASLPPRAPKPEPAPRQSVVATIHAPARVDPAPTKEKPGRVLWDQIKDSDQLDRFVAMGKARGWPPLIVNWSAGMVREARAACPA